jgi:hypothetical protein
MNRRVANRTVSKTATPKNRAASPAFLFTIEERGASFGVFILPPLARPAEGRRKRDKFLMEAQKAAFGGGNVSQGF